ncbi:hypothetical protein J6590_031715 [Homalodisca vitripennis]|nr:hypothetical protein J6590_031715 [Homalodisca vitripennis]
MQELEGSKVGESVQGHFPYREDGLWLPPPQPIEMKITIHFILQWSIEREGSSLCSYQLSPTQDDLTISRVYFAHVLVRDNLVYKVEVRVHC